MPEDEKPGLSLSSQIAIALAAGVLFGIFFGELAGFLSVVADGYIKLLQMTVLPYVTVSLIAGLGTLQYQQAKTLLFRVGGLMVLLWGLTLILVLLMPLSFRGRRHRFSVPHSCSPGRSSTLSTSTSPPIPFTL